MRWRKEKSELILRGHRSVVVKWISTKDLCHPFHFAIVVDVVSELARDDALTGILYDDTFVSNESIEGLGNMFRR